MPGRPLRRRLQPRSLGAKLVLVLTLVGLAGAAGLALLLAAIITPSFHKLETQAVDAHVERTRAALKEYGSKVETAVRDYGDWNQSYDYMGHQTPAFEKESFSPLAMANLDVDGMAYVAPDGHVVIARWHAPRSEADDPVLRARLLGLIARTNFAQVLGTRHSGNFYARLGRGVAAIGVAQVRKSDGSGTPRGWVLMARTIGSAKLSQLLQLSAQLDPAATGDVPQIVPAHSTLAITVPVPGKDGQAVAGARFSVPRDLSLLGRRMLIYTTIASALLLLLIVAMLSRLITRVVLRPLGRVEAHMVAVRDSGALQLLEGEEARADEIGSLGRSFNAMLTQLKDLREQVEVQSFALGRTESAVAVMHNVRNALNPISTILSQGIALPPPVDRSLVDRAVAELAREAMLPERRQKLAAFVTAAVQAETADREERRRQLQIGREALAHVLEIIGTQQAHAHERPPLEVCDVTQLIAQNATIARYSDQVSIAFSFPGKPHLVLANRLLLSQVIGNLFSNAAEAVAAAGATSGSITVTVRERADTTEVLIRDSGEGFEPEVGATLFQRGFSTRQHKSGGLGLHWCANSVNAMEGGLRLESGGRGQGAVAILTLRTPVAEVRADAA